MHMIARHRLAVGVLALITSAALASVITASVDTPELTNGSYWSDGFFTGPVDVVAGFEDSLFGLGATAEITLDACASGSCPTGDSCATGSVSWQSADVITGFGTQHSLSGSRDALYSDVAALHAGGGEWVNVYQVESGDWDIYAQLLNADGSTNGQPIAIHDDANAEQRQPRVAGLANGNFAVTWVEDDGDDLGVFVQVFSSSGAAVSQPQIANDQVVVGRQHSPVIAASDNGSFLVSWTTGWDPLAGPNFEQDGATLDISMRAFAGNGAAIDNEDILPSLSGDHESWAAITGVPGAGWLGAWKAYTGQPPSVSDIEIAARSVSYTQAKGSSFLLDSNSDITEATRVQLATSPDGNRIVAVWEMNAGGQRQVRVRVFDSNLVAIGSAFAVDNGSSYDQLRPDVTFVDDVTAIVAWAEVESSGEGRVLARAIDADLSATRQSVFRLDDDDSSAEIVAAPSLASHTDGSILATWSERQGDVNASSAVYGRLLEPRGTILASNVAHGNQDMDVQLRWTDTDGTQRCSSVASWYWADPNAGSSATVTYLDGPTNALNAAVDGAFSPGPDTQFLSLELQAREADLLGGNCGIWSGWFTQESGVLPSMSVQEWPDLPDISCVQYRWVLTNRARIPYEHSSAAITRVDREPPAIERLELDVELDELVSTLTSMDEHVGLDRATVSLSQGAEQEIDPNGTSRTAGLQDGAQNVSVTVYDLATNTDVRGGVVVADLATPAVDILSIEDGDVVADGVPLVYAVQGDIVSLRLELDGASTSISSTLSGLSEGYHEVSLIGQTSESLEVSDTVWFTVDNSVVTAVLTAPGPQRYEYDSVTAAWWVSDSTAEVTLSLDGGSFVADPTFTGLADGSHTLELRAVTSDGRAGSDTVTFETEDVVPLLVVDSPQSGQTLGSGTPQVLCTASVNDIRWEVEGRNGTMSCGERIPNDGSPLGDGTHTLYVTAYHENGNSDTETISFTVDTRPFDLRVVSPVEGLYADTSIPLQWSTSTTTSAVIATLDGLEVEELVNIAPGRHELLVTATAETGSQDTEVVNFVISPLEILSPNMGEEVASPELPPEVPLVLEGGDDCASLTATVDDGAPQVITATSGEPTYLPMDRGEHTIRVTCTVGEETLTQLVDFEIGEMNVSVGDGSLRYDFENCSDEWACDVTVHATLGNAGDFDVNTPFNIRFDHITQNGDVASATQVIEVAELAEGDTVTVSFAPVRAALEERFAVFVDPDEQLQMETRDDNYAEVRFLAASLNAASWVHEHENTFISGTSLTNGVIASTSGSVSQLRVTAGELVVVDDISAGEGTWHALSDMGLLSPEDDCVEIAVITEDGAAVDARAWCPTVQSTPISPEGSTFPWYRYVTDGAVRMSSLDRQELLLMAHETNLANLTSNAAPMMPVLNEDGTVEYLLLAMVGEADDPLRVNMGTQPLVGGAWQLPSQTALFAVSISPTTGDCTVQGTVLTDDQGFIRQYEEAGVDIANDFIQSEFEDVDIGALIEEYAGNAGLSTIAAELPFGSNNFLIANVLPPSSQTYYFGFYGIGIMDASLSAPYFELTDAAEEQWEAGFQTELCTVSLMGIPIGIDATATMYAEGRSEVHLLLEGQSVDYIGLGLPHWNWIPIPIMFGMSISAEVYPQDIGIHGEMELGAEMRLSSLSMDLQGESLAAARISSETDYRPLSSVSGIGYFVFGYGYGEDWRTSWITDAYGLASADGEYDFGAQQLTYGPTTAYSRFYLYALTERRTRHCFLWWCSWSDWGEFDETAVCEPHGDETLRAADPCSCEVSEPARRDCMAGASVPFIIQ